MLTGLRKSELFRLSWDWCDFENGMLLVKEAKRGSSKMPMSSRVKDELLKLGPRPSGRVFPGHFRALSGDKRRDPTKTLTDKRRALANVLEAAGVDPSGVTLHTFRRAFITALEEIPGVSYSVVRALARHARSASDVTTHYLFPTDERLRQALEGLEARLFGPSNVVAFPVARTA